MEQFKSYYHDQTNLYSKASVFMWEIKTPNINLNILLDLSNQQQVIASMAAFLDILCAWQHASYRIRRDPKAGSNNYTMHNFTIVEQNLELLMVIVRSEDLSACCSQRHMGFSPKLSDAF